MGDYDCNNSKDLISLTGGLSPFESKAFNHFLSGDGKMLKLTDTEKNSLLKEIKEEGQLYSSGSIIINDKEYTLETISLYSSEEFAAAVGRFQILKDDSELVAIYDKYDFDKKEWGTRDFISEVKTRLIKMFGEQCNGKSYTICSDIDSEEICSSKYIKNLK